MLRCDTHLISTIFQSQQHARVFPQDLDESHGLKLILFVELPDDRGRSVCADWGGQRARRWRAAGSTVRNHYLPWCLDNFINIEEKKRKKKKEPKFVSGSVVPWTMTTIRSASDINDNVNDDVIWQCSCNKYVRFTATKSSIFRSRDRSKEIFERTYSSCRQIFSKHQRRAALHMSEYLYSSSNICEKYVSWCITWYWGFSCRTYSKICWDGDRYISQR